ncbi:MAG: tetratricopeptide repeat protein, partial [Thermovirgaceae bacterium]|nr:tetratricopeptide repeat protein [Thermovirgaceae bacterium]
EDTISAEPPSVTENIAELSVEEIEREYHITEEDELPDISTPTLAEVYFNQGQIHEALKTYERVVAQNPDDDQSKKRLEELREMVSSEAAPSEESGADRFREKNRKVIAVLEGWLANIRGMSESPSSQ